MKKLLPLFLLPLSLWAQKSTVTGNLQTTSGAAPASYVEFALSNCGNNQPRVQGVTMLLPAVSDFYADATGTITAAANGGVTPQLYGNDVIVCGTASNTLYGMQLYLNGQPLGPTKYYNVLSTAGFNINTAMPVQQNLPSPPINPPQNGQFLNLNVINSLSAGSATIAGAVSAASAQITGALTAAQVNGVVNPTTYPGADLGAQINNAFQATCIGPAAAGATPLCTLKVPPGIYTVSTDILMPDSLPYHIHNAALILDGATLNFTGAGIIYGIFTGFGADHAFLHGGYLLFQNAPNAKAGVVLGQGSQGCYIQEVRETGVMNGDGLLNLGANVCTIFNNTFNSNLIGVHLLGSPGYASNANKLIGNIISGNAREGINDGDISQYPVGWPDGRGNGLPTAGTSTPNFNNLIFANDLEVNGSSSNNGSENTIYPAVLIALTNGEVVAGNYFEATPYEQVKLGCLNYTDAVYQNLYGKSGPNCGTAQGPTIRENYVTTAGGSDYFLNYSNGATVTGNSDQAAAANACFVNGNVGINSTINNNNYLSTSEFCIGGAPVTPTAWSSNAGPNVTATDAATAGSRLFFNANGNYMTSIQVMEMTLGGPPTPSNPNNGSGSNPHCDPAWSRGALWIDTCTSGASGCVTGGGVAWICKDDTVLATPIADGHATWVKAF